MSHFNLDLAERASVAVTYGNVCSLVDFYQANPNTIGFAPALVLGRDIHKHLGEDGFEVWRELMWEHETPLLHEDLFPGDPRKATTVERFDAYLVEEWADYAQGEMHWTEMLLIDAMARAREQGWQIADLTFDDATGMGSYVAGTTTEAILDDLARRSGAKRAAVEADLRAAEDREEEARFAQYDAIWKTYPMPSNAAARLHAVKTAPLSDLLTSSADFIRGFVPPEYLIDGMVQRRYFYSMTAQTGVGKTSIAMRWMAHVVCGRPIGDKDVQQGHVLYLAGENPDDVRARWLVLSREMGINPNTDKVTWIVGAKDLAVEADRLVKESTDKGLSYALAVVDTAAAYNVAGDEENNNNQAGAYARQLRSLTNLPGGPCVVVLCHPTKNAGDDALVPRGGGAFIAEVDGNLAVMRKDSQLVVVPLGKFRGDMSWSQRYEIEVVKDHTQLKDARGRQMNSVLARPLGDGAAAILEKRTDIDMQAVLNVVHSAPSATPSDLARLLGWTFGPKAQPNVNKVKRNLDRLAKDKLVREIMGKWRVTLAGEKELNAIDTAKAVSLANLPLPPLP
jgi:hypothetical protein